MLHPRHRSSLLWALPFATTLLVPHGGAGAETAEPRISRIEQGLLPPIVVLGEPTPHLSLIGEMARKKVPGVSVAVIDNGRLSWARGYGVLEAGKADSVTTEAMFQAGSVSKPITAMTALRLVERGRLKLDEDVNHTLRSWRIPASDSSNGIAITLRMLLTHSAGFTVHGFPGYASGDSIPTLVQILDGAPPANTQPVRVDMTPGKAFRYSGGGFCVAQQLLIDATGEAYADLATQNVLQRASMKHSSYDQPVGPVRGERRASGHGHDGVAISGGWHRYPELAAAGLWTTPGDLARLVLDVQASFRGDRGHVLSPETTRNMLAPQITPSQGIGWRLGGTGSNAYFEHSGDTDGYACVVVGFLHRGQGAVVMTNGAAGGDLAQEILRGIAREYGWGEYVPVVKRAVPVSGTQLARVIGRYALDIAPNVFIDVSASGDSVYVTVTQPGGTQRGYVLAESPTHFFEVESGIEITFPAEAGDLSSSLFVHEGEEEYRATRVR